MTTGERRNDRLRGPETTVKDSELVSLMRTRRSKRRGVVVCLQRQGTHVERTRETRENEYTGEGGVASESALTLQRQGTHVERTSGLPLQGSGARWVSETATEKRLRKRAGKKGDRAERKRSERESE